MRRWIVMASHDDRGERQPKVSEPNTLERVTSFTSGDGDAPMEGDLAEALEGYAGLEEGQELLLFPLDAATMVRVKTTTHVDVAWTVNVLQ